MVKCTNEVAGLHNNEFNLLYKEFNHRVNFFTMVIKLLYSVVQLTVQTQFLGCQVCVKNKLFKISFEGFFD